MNLAQAAAGEPMTLRQEPTLSFARIADAWAQETTGQVGALTRDEIVARLIAAYDAAEFECAAHDGDLVLGPFGADPDQGDGLALWSSVADQDTGEPGDWRPVDRRHRATVACVGVMSRIIAKRSDSASAARARIQLIESSIISRPAFRAWAMAAGHALPRFWFSAAEIAERSETAVLTVKTKRNGGRTPGAYSGYLTKRLDSFLVAPGRTFFERPLSAITKDVRTHFDKDGKHAQRGIVLPKSRDGLETPIKRWMEERGIESGRR